MKRMTKLQKDYAKQVKRIEKNIVKLAEQSFYINKRLDILSAKPSKYNLERIKNITISDLKVMATKVNTETGESQTYRQALDLKYKAKREQKKDKPKRTKYVDKAIENHKEKTQGGYIKYPSFSEVVISNAKEEWSKYPKMAYPLMMSWLEEMLKNYDENEVAEMLEEGKRQGLFPNNVTAYDKEALLGNIGHMLAYLPNMSEGFKEELLEQFEYSEDWLGYKE